MSSRSAAVFAAVAVLIAAAIVLLLGCKDPNVPRAAARGAVETTATAVKVAANACAVHSLATEDVELARTCAKHYDAARVILIATAAGVDAWDTGAAGSVTCGVRNASLELAALARELEAKGGKPPPIVADAFDLVSTLAPCGGAK